MEKKLRSINEIETKLDELDKKYGEQMPTMKDVMNLMKQNLPADKVQEQLFLQNSKMSERWFTDAQRFALQQILSLEPEKMQRETKSRMEFLDQEIIVMNQNEGKRLSELKNQPYEINSMMAHMKKSQTLTSYEGQLEMLQWALNG